MNSEDFAVLNSMKLAEMIDETKDMILHISEEYAESLNNFECLKNMEECIKSQIVCGFIDQGKKYNEALRRAECSEEFIEYKNKMNQARDALNPLEIRYRAFNHIIDAITSLAYVKNSEIKRGL